MEKEVGVEITTSDGVAVVTFMAVSISNMEAIAAVSKRIHAFLEENQPTKVIFDFEKVKFFSSQVLGVLLEVRAKLRAATVKL